MILNIELIETLEELDPSLKQAFIKVLKVLEKRLGEVVRREDFLELKNDVSELVEVQKRTEAQLHQIVEIQKDTEQRLNELAEAQRRTEQTVSELVEAQKKSEERLTRLEQAVAELAEAQKKTEETMHQGFKELRDQIAALGSRWGLQTESVFRNTVKSLLDRAGYQVTKGYYGDREVDVVIRNGEHILLEITSSMKKSDIERYNRSAQDYKQKTGIMPRIMVAAIYISPTVMREILDSPIPIEIFSTEEE